MMSLLVVVWSGSLIGVMVLVVFVLVNCGGGGGGDFEDCGSVVGTVDSEGNDNDCRISCCCS